MVFNEVKVVVERNLTTEVDTESTRLSLVKVAVQTRCELAGDKPKSFKQVALKAVAICNKGGKHIKNI